MAKGKRMSEREKAMAEAVELQKRFDAAAAVDPMGARAVVYGEVFDAALAEDADRTFDRYRWTVEMLERERASAQSAVATFAERLAANPVDAFRWGNDALLASVRLEAYTGLLTVLRDRGVVVAKAWALETAQRSAREAFPRSTSAMSNLVDAARAQVWAELTDGDYRAPLFV